jgi:hypothetical protein
MIFCKHKFISMRADNIPKNGLWDYTEPRLFCFAQ